MRELPASVQNAIDLGRLIKLFCLKWIKLNAEVLRGGQTTLSTLLERELVKNEHARTSERTAIKIALEKSTQIVIDGYVMDGKLTLFKSLKLSPLFHPKIIYSS